MLLNDFRTLFAVLLPNKVQQTSINKNIIKVWRIDRIESRGMQMQTENFLKAKLLRVTVNFIVNSRIAKWQIASLVRLPLMKNVACVLGCIVKNHRSGTNKVPSELQWPSNPFLSQANKNNNSPQKFHAAKVAEYRITPENLPEKIKTSANKRSLIIESFT